MPGQGDETFIVISSRPCEGIRDLVRLALRGGDLGSGAGTDSRAGSLRRAGDLLRLRARRARGGRRLRRAAGRLARTAPGALRRRRERFRGLAVLVGLCAWPAQRGPRPREPGRPGRPAASHRGRRRADRVARARRDGAARSRLRRAVPPEPGARARVGDPVRPDGAEGGLGGERPHGLRGRRRALAHGRCGPPARPDLGSAGLPARRRRSRGRRPRGAPRTAPLGARPARGRVRAAGRHARDAVGHRLGSRELGRGRAVGRRRPDRGADPALPVPRARRARLDHPSLRPRLRARDGPAHGGRLRGGLLRRGAPRQELDRDRLADLVRRGARRHPRPRQAGDRGLDGDADQGRAARDRDEAAPADRARLDAARRRRQCTARGPRLLPAPRTARRGRELASAGSLRTCEGPASRPRAPGSAARRARCRAPRRARTHPDPARRGRLRRLGPRAPGSQDPRLHVGARRPRGHAHAGGLRGGGGAGRVRIEARSHPRRTSLRRSPLRHGDGRALPQRQREQAHARHRPPQARVPRGDPRPRALGGRRVRLVHTRCHGADGPRRGGAPRREPGRDPAQHLAHGPDRPARDLLGLRQPLGRDRRLPRDDGLARPGRLRPLRRLHRLRDAQVRRLGDPRGARPPRPHGRGQDAGPVAGRGLAALPGARHARPSRERRRPDARGKPGRARRAARVLPGRGRRPLDRDRRRERRRVPRALRCARRGRPRRRRALRDGARPPRERRRPRRGSRVA